MSIRRYTGERIVKAMQTQDATFSRAGSALTSLARWGFSLIAGAERPGWYVGVDGYTARPLDGQPSQIMALIGTNEVIYACMRERMKVLITPTFLVERRQADGSYAADDDHPLAALIRRPGQNLDTAAFWRCLEASYSSLGRVYLEPLYTTNGRILGALNPLNPAYVEEQYDGLGRLVAYDWQPPDAAGVRFLPDELITRRAVGWSDVPPLIAALGAADADRLSNEFIGGFFSGGGIPSGIIKGRGTWDQERADDFRNAWMRRFTAGQRLPAILDDSIESYERVGVSLDELDNETLRMFIETRMCMCFGVPPLIIYAYAGLLKATYSNLSEAWESFWDATALPLLKEWAEWITWTLLTLYEDPDAVRAGLVRVRFDVSQIGPYQEDVNAKIVMFKEGFDAGAVKLNEYRAVLGLDADPQGDVYKDERAAPAVLELPQRQEVANE